MLIGSLISAVIAGLIIWIVAKLKLGLEVESFAWAMIAGVLIGVVTNLIMQFMTDFGGWGGALVHLVVSAGVILGAGSFLKGLKVNGYTGALIAALAIAVVNWLAAWLIGLTGLV
jgi:putative membrane protein